MSDIPVILELWDFRDIAKSETTFREWMGKVPETEPYHLELKTQLARTMGLRSRFDEAHAILDEVEPEIKQSTAVEVRYLLERGRSFNSSNRQAEALPLFEQAWAIAKEAKLDYLAVDAAHMMGIAEPDYATQIEWDKLGLQYIEQSKQEDTKKWYRALYNNMGWSYHDAGDYENALASFEKGVAWCEAHADLTSTRIAKYTVARTLRSLERYEQAITKLKALFADYESTGDEESGFTSEEMGECLLALNRADEAKPHFAKAYRLLKDISWVEEDRLARIQQLSQ